MSSTTLHDSVDRGKREHDVALAEDFCFGEQQGDRFLWLAFFGEDYFLHVIGAEFLMGAVLEHHHHALRHGTGASHGEREHQKIKLLHSGF